jgi:hypothetical protein
VKPVPGPSGAAITTRLRTTPEDDTVLDAVARHLGRLRRADLAYVCHPVPSGLSLDDDVNRQARRDALNARKHAITAESSSRWAGTIIRANDDQYRLARESQARHIVSLGAAISSIEKRLGQPTGDMLAREDRKTRKGPNTWPTPTLAGTSSLAGRSLPTVRPSGRPALPAASPPHRNHCPA